MKLLSVLLFALVAEGFLPAQTAPPIRVDVRLVNVFVNVTDTNGAPVANLTKDDFTLTEDGHPQKIAVFERESNIPLSIVLAIDTSGSVNKDLAIEKDRKSVV